MDHHARRETCNLKEGSLVIWLDQEKLDVVFVFFDMDGLDHAFTGWFPPRIGECFFLKETRWACNKFEGCFILLHEGLFSRVGFYFPFYDLEVDVLNRLGVSSSQLHPVRRIYVKVFRCWCEYHKRMASLTLFFHLFNVQHLSTDFAHGQGLIFLKYG